MKKQIMLLIFLATFFIIPAKASSLFPVNKASSNSLLWAYMNKNGSLETSFQYFEASPFNKHGLATVTDINGFVSVINEDIKTIVKPQKAPISVDFGDEMLAFRYKNKSVYFTLKGTLVGTLPVTSGFFSDGLIPAQKNGLWGYMNTKGEFEIEPIYASAGNFQNGFAVVQFENKKNYGIITKNNVVSLLPKNTIPKYLKIWNNDIIILLENGLHHLYSVSSGQFINELAYQEIGEFHNGFAPARINNMWGIINLEGKPSVNMNYYDLSYIGNGLYSARGSSDKTGTCSIINANGDIIYRTDVYVSGFNSVSNGVLWHGTLNNQIVFISEKGAYLSSFENAEDAVILTDDTAKITIAGKVKYVNIKTGDVLYVPETDYSFESFKVNTKTYEKYIGVDSSGNDNEWLLTYPVLCEMADKDVQNKINSHIQEFFIEGPKVPLINQSLKGTFGIAQAGRVVVVWSDCVYGTGNGSAIWNDSIAIDLNDGTKYNVIKDLFTKDYVDIIKKHLPSEIPFYMFSYPRISSTGITFYYNLPQDNNSERYFPTSKEYFIPYSSIDNAINKSGKLYNAIKSNLENDITIFKTNFSDVSQNHWAFDAIQKVSKLELMEGNKNEFFPDKPIKTIEVIAIIVRLLKIDTSTIQIPDNAPWYYKELYAAEQAGILNDVLETNITNDINREDTMQIIINSFGNNFEQLTEQQANEILFNFSDKELVSKNRLLAVAMCVNQKIILGSDNKIMPNKTLSRAQFAQILSNML